MREHPDKRRHLDLRRAVLGRAFPLGIALLLLVSCPSWAWAQACNNIDQKTRQALQALVQVHYPAAGGASSDCGETGRHAGRTLIEHGEAILPCLTEIFHHGLSRSDLWVYGGHVPTDGRWTIELIRNIDAPSAIRLYREWRSEVPGSDLKRFGIDTELAALGDTEYLPTLVSFLQRPPEVPSSEKRRLRLLQDRAVEVMSIRDHLPALPAFEALATSSPRGRPWLAVYTAQLSRDTDRLLRFAGDPQTSSWALLALRRMNRTDLLRSFAENPTYRSRALAQDLLEGRAGP